MLVGSSLILIRSLTELARSVGVVAVSSKSRSRGRSSSSRPAVCLLIRLPIGMGRLLVGWCSSCNVRRDSGNVGQLLAGGGSRTNMCARGEAEQLVAPAVATTTWLQLLALVCSPQSASGCCCCCSSGRRALNWLI